MKIISKEKDYYDYFVSIRGRDEYIVYDRRGAVSPAGKWQYSFTLLHICDYSYPIVQNKGVFYFTPCNSSLRRDENDFLSRGRAISEINNRESQPVLMTDKWGYYPQIPNLSRITGWPAIMPAEEIYDQIYNWLMAKKNPPTVKQDNKGKILSHGFDLKTSFRPHLKS